MVFWILSRYDEKMKKRISLILKILVGLIILITLSYKVGISDIIKHMEQFNPLYLIIILPLYILIIFFGTLNLLLLLKSSKLRIKFKKLLRYYFTSWSMGLFIPGKLGEFSMVYFLKKENIGIGKGLAILLVDQILTLIVLGILSMVSVIIIFHIKSMWIGILAILVIMGLLIISKTNKKLRILIRKFILRKHEKKFTGFAKIVGFLIRERKSILIINLLITIIKYILHALVLYVILISIGGKFSLWMILIISSLAKAIGLIPITINGLGVKESVAVYIFGIVGLDASLVTAMYITTMIISYVVGIVGVLTFKKQWE